MHFTTFSEAAQLCYYMGSSRRRDGIEMNTTKREQITIIIPAKNEERNIRRCLTAVADQETEAKVDVVLIDSGSTDRTPEIAREFEFVRLHCIPAEEFAHGKTRNLGATLAGDGILVFLNGDAIPKDSQWLEALIAPFREDSSVAGTYSRHAPQEDCHLYMKRDLAQSMPPETTVERIGDRPLDFTQFSTVSGAIPKDVWRQFPFDDRIAIAEDQDWAKRVLDAGYKIVYASGSVVTHSHNYSNRQLYGIKFSVAQSFHRFKSRRSALVYGFVLAVGGFVVKTLGDWKYIWTAGLGFGETCRQTRIALGARAATFWGKFRGWIHRRTDEQV
jgi:rhamnosyltransferase